MVMEEVAIMILVLSLILFLLLVTINKKRGFKAFCSLYINLFFIILVVNLITWGLNPIIAALIFSLGTSAFILFFINGVNKKTKIAYLSVVSVILMMSLFIIFFVIDSNMYGFVRQHASFLFAFSQNISINYVHVTIAVQIMLLTAAITNTALDISTALNEVCEKNPQIKPKELIKSAKNIASDVLGTMINTLFFIFIADFMGFIFFYNRLGFAYWINHKLLIQGVSSLLLVAIGCILIIPLVIIIQSHVFTKKKLM